MRCLYNSSSVRRYGIQMEIIDSTFHLCLTYFQDAWYKRAEFEFSPFVLGCRQVEAEREKKKKCGSLTEDYLLLLNHLQRQKSRPKSCNLEAISINTMSHLRRKLICSPSSPSAWYGATLTRTFATAAQFKLSPNVNGTFVMGLRHVTRPSVRPELAEIAD